MPKTVNAVLVLRDKSWKTAEVQMLCMIERVSQFLYGQDTQEIWITVFRVN